jgi:hypothetical protein
MVNERKFTAADIIAALEAMGDDTLRSDANAVDRGSGGTLADILADACRDEGVTLGDLTVLSAGNDPYRCATPDQVRNAQWAADRFAEVPAPHLRGFHYKLLGRVKKPERRDLLRLQQGLAVAETRGRCSTMARAYPVRRPGGPARGPPSHPPGGARHDGARGGRERQLQRRATHG